MQSFNASPSSAPQVDLHTQTHMPSQTERKDRKGYRYKPSCATILSPIGLWSITLETTVTHTSSICQLIVHNIPTTQYTCHKVSEMK